MIEWLYEKGYREDPDNYFFQALRYGNIEVCHKNVFFVYNIYRFYNGS